VTPAVVHHPALALCVIGGPAVAVVVGVLMVLMVLVVVVVVMVVVVVVAVSLWSRLWLIKQKKPWSVVLGDVAWPDLPWVHYSIFLCTTCRSSG
jgi:glycerol-3-phosphate acyltransferase PlsY